MASLQGVRVVSAASVRVQLPRCSRMLDAFGGVVRRELVPRDIEVECAVKQWVEVGSGHDSCASRGTATCWARMSRQLRLWCGERQGFRWSAAELGAGFDGILLTRDGDRPIPQRAGTRRHRATP